MQLFKKPGLFTEGKQQKPMVIFFLLIKKLYQKFLYTGGKQTTELGFGLFDI